MVFMTVVVLYAITKIAMTFFGLILDRIMNTCDYYQLSVRLTLLVGMSPEIKQHILHF